MSSLQQIRQVAAGIVQRMAHLSRVSTVISRRQQVMRIMMFHGAAGPEVEVLAEQLRFLARNYRVVPLSGVVDAVRGRARQRGQEVALTFDDGLLNNYLFAYPLLRQLGLPATFFVCPELVDRREWIWTHEARARLDSASPGARGELAQELGATGRAPEHVVQWLKGLSDARRLQAMLRLQDATPRFRPSRAQKLRYQLMTWRHLRELDPQLISIGSHTLTHPILPRCPPAKIRREVGHSRRVLEQRMGRPVRFFCYPDGQSGLHAARAVAANYDAATSNVGTFTLGWDRRRLPRIPTADSVSYLAWRMFRPAA